MKKLLLVLLVFSIPVFCLAQVHTVVDTNNLWSNLIISDFANGNASTSMIRIGNSAQIDSKEYYEILYTTDSAQSWWNPIGFIREDDQHRVFARKQNDSTEFLLYDFNLVPGDTVAVSKLNLMLQDTILLLVQSQDSVLIGGSWRKRLRMINPDTNTMYYPYSYYWIEGLGSIKGFLENNFEPVDGGDQHLLCFTYGGNVLYTHPSFNSCYIKYDHSSIRENRLSRTRIFPNPATDILNFDFLFTGTYELTVLSLDGKKVLNEQVNDAKDFKLSLSHIPTGIYLLSVKNDQIQITRKLVILN